MDVKARDRQVFKEVAAFNAAAVDSVHLQLQELPPEGPGRIDRHHALQSQDLRFPQALTREELLGARLASSL